MAEGARLRLSAVLPRWVAGAAEAWGGKDFWATVLVAQAAKAQWHPLLALRRLAAAGQVGLAVMDSPEAVAGTEAKVLRPVAWPAQRLVAVPTARLVVLGWLAKAAAMAVMAPSPAATTPRPLAAAMALAMRPRPRPKMPRHWAMAPRPQASIP